MSVYIIDKCERFVSQRAGCGKAASPDSVRGVRPQGVRLLDPGRFEEKTGNGWKKILWYSGKIAFIFSVSIEMLQLLFRLGTFQLSDIFYNTVGGVLGGLVYYVTMKARKHL